MQSQLPFRSSVLFIALLWFFPVNSQGKLSPAALPQETKVAKKNVLHQIAGSAYLKKALEYYLIQNGDTSLFNCTFTEAKEKSRISLDLNFQHSSPSLTYLEKLEELKLILPEASLDFNFDSLSSIHLGRLVSTGDLAIAVANQYQKEFGAQSKQPPYSVFSAFLMKTKLAGDINMLFLPYGLSVKSISIEKLFFTTSAELLSTKIEETPELIPAKIPDCIIWVNLENKWK